MDLEDFFNTPVAIKAPQLPKFQELELIVKLKVLFVDIFNTMKAQSSSQEIVACSLQKKQKQN